MSAARSLDLAILGGPATFEKPLPVGQLYFPAWEAYEAKFRDIFARQYYTNQGPLAHEFERRLEAFFGVRHAICVTNATIGLIMAAEALGLRGKVVTPSFTFIATARRRRSQVIWTATFPRSWPSTSGAAVAISRSFRRWLTNASCDCSMTPRMRSDAA
jgi:hypothetical protein